MQLHQDFRAFNFEITNFRLFKRNYYQLEMTMTSVWRKFSDDVFANTN